MTRALAKSKLGELSQRLIASQMAIGEHAGSIVSHAVEAGLVLVEAKELVSHGEWEGWVASHGINLRTAQLYMQIAAHRDEIASNQRRNGVALLSLRAAVKLIAKPKPKALPAPSTRVPESENETSAHASTVEGGEVCETSRGYTDGILKCKHKGCGESFEGPLPEGWAGMASPCGQWETARCPDHKGPFVAACRAMAGEKLTRAELVQILSEAIRDGGSGNANVELASAIARQILKELKRRERDQ